MTEQETREHCAKLAEALMQEKPYVDQPWARMALAIVARAIRRGRHLTEQERLLNLADAMAEDDPSCQVAARLRRIASGSPAAVTSAE